MLQNYQFRQSVLGKKFASSEKQSAPISTIATYNIQTPVAVHVEATLSSDSSPSIFNGIEDVTVNATLMAKTEMLESKNAET